LSSRNPRSIIRMTPWAFYRELVWPNFWMFGEDRGSIVKAFNAAIPAVQLADHFYYYFEMAALVARRQSLDRILLQSHRIALAVARLIKDLSAVAST
jgi:hypothetical protein